MSQGMKQQSMKLDYLLLVTVLLVLSMGLIIMSSASIDVASSRFDQPWHYLFRQVVYIGLGFACAWFAWHIPVVLWEAASCYLFFVGLSLLILVLLFGNEVNGSVRWLSLGLFQLQVSELVKLFTIIYVAGYLARHAEEVCTSCWGFVRPLILLGLVAFLLLLEPDFGTTVVLFLTVMGMMFLAGAKLWQFIVLLSSAGAGLLFLALLSPYRLKRLLAFLDPWEHYQNSGFQLAQSLMAFGRGEWLGVGLGDSVQKLSYLPESYTDFVFAVLAEELGVIGSVFVIALFSVIIWRAFAIGHQAEKLGDRFAAFTAYGIACWLSLQVFINMGVNLGILPTKGLTLPLMSYGGSSMIVTCVAIALLLRIYAEYSAWKPRHREKE